MKLTLIKKEPVTEDIISFVWDPPAGFTWLPGQYMHVTLPHDQPDDRGIERWFTIAAAPFESKPRITTRIVADHPSTFKQALYRFEPGSTIEVDQPEGDFVMGDQHAEYVFIAGGIGFTPFHAILTELDHQGTMPSIEVIYGVRSRVTAYQDELAELSQKYPQLKVEYVVAPAQINQEVINRLVADITKPYFYVSGPEPMVIAFDKMLQQMGVPQANIRKDEFPGYSW